MADDRAARQPDASAAEALTATDLRDVVAIAARQPAPTVSIEGQERDAARLLALVDGETNEVVAERTRAASLGYDEHSDDERGAYALARDASGYLARGIAQGNRSDFIKAAGLLLNAAASFRRNGSPLGIEVSRG